MDRVQEELRQNCWHLSDKNTLIGYIMKRGNNSYEESFRSFGLPKKEY